MEDDAMPVQRFTDSLANLVAQLPSDWDVLQLRGCMKQAPPDWSLIGEGLRMHHRGACTLPSTIDLSCADLPT